MINLSLGSQNAARLTTRYDLQKSTTSSSMSHMITLSTVLCLRISLAVEPSPPPMMKIFLGLSSSKTGYTFFLSNGIVIVNIRVIEFTLHDEVEAGAQDIHGR